MDWAIIKAARDLNRPHLGHSCPKFMFYVEDDTDPVYVAETSRIRLFVRRSLDILIAANGRMQAFRHDIMAVFEKMKHASFVNVLKSISTNGDCRRWMLMVVPGRRRDLRAAGMVAQRTCTAQ
ncbi:MAG: hypothetical protein R3D26_04120 [Cyanobacteriota/Melainabacteria group bacterium]